MNLKMLYISLLALYQLVVSHQLKNSNESQFSFRSKRQISLDGPRRMCPSSCKCAFERSRFTTDCSVVYIAEQKSDTERVFMQSNLASYPEDADKAIQVHRNSFSEIPRDISTTTSVLRIANHPLRRLTETKAFARRGLKNLLELDINNCSLEAISPDALSGLSNLQTLSLQHNRFSRLVAKQFGALHELLTLDLSYNHLATLQNGIFDGAYYLTKLDLSHNVLEFISDGAFDGLPRLRAIHLENNQLMTIRPEPFQHLGSLKTLNLVSNPWVCDCHLRKFIQWMYYNSASQHFPTAPAHQKDISGNIIANKNNNFDHISHVSRERRRFFTEPPLCLKPFSRRSKSWILLQPEEFACGPIILTAPTSSGTSGYGPSTRTVVTGERVALPCDATGDPLPNIQWEFRGEVQPAMPEGVTLTPKIQKLTRNNYLGFIILNDTSSAVDASIFDTKNPTKADNARIISTPDGHLNTRQLGTNSGRKFIPVVNSRLVIPQVGRYNTGQYHCIASNPQGQAYIVYLVQLPPGGSSYDGPGGKHYSANKSALDEELTLVCLSAVGICAILMGLLLIVVYVRRHFRYRPIAAVEPDTKCDKSEKCRQNYLASSESGVLTNSGLNYEFDTSINFGHPKSGMSTECVVTDVYAKKKPSFYENDPPVIYPHINAGARDNSNLPYSLEVSGTNRNKFSGQISMGRADSSWRKPQQSSTGLPVLSSSSSRRSNTSWTSNYGIHVAALRAQSSRENLKFSNNKAQPQHPNLYGYDENQDVRPKSSGIQIFNPNTDYLCSYHRTKGYMSETLPSKRPQPPRRAMPDFENGENVSNDIYQASTMGRPGHRHSLETQTLLSISELDDTLGQQRAADATIDSRTDGLTNDVSISDVFGGTKYAGGSKVSVLDVYGNAIHPIHTNVYGKDEDCVCQGKDSTDIIIQNNSGSQINIVPQYDSGFVDFKASTEKSQYNGVENCRILSDGKIVQQDNLTTLPRGQKSEQYSNPWTTATKDALTVTDAWLEESLVNSLPLTEPKHQPNKARNTSKNPPSSQLNTYSANNRSNNSGNVALINKSNLKFVNASRIQFEPPRAEGNVCDSSTKIGIGGQHASGDSLTGNIQIDNAYRCESTASSSSLFNPCSERTTESGNCTAESGAQIESGGGRQSNKGGNNTGAVERNDKTIMRKQLNKDEDNYNNNNSSNKNYVSTMLINQNSSDNNKTTKKYLEENGRHTQKQVVANKHLNNCNNNENLRYGNVNGNYNPVAIANQESLSDDEPRYLSSSSAPSAYSSSISTFTNSESHEIETPNVLGSESTQKSQILARIGVKETEL